VAAKIVYEQHGRQVVVPLDGDCVTIGRDHRNDIVIERPSVSRRHARLERAGGRWRVVDVGSAYGTRVNDLAHANKPLEDGDRILLHDFPLLFTEGEVSCRDPLPGASGAAELGRSTVFQHAVGFSALAAAASDASHLRRLLLVASRTSEVILACRSLDETFRRVLDLVFEQLPVQRGFIMLRGGEAGELVTRCVKHAAATDSGAPLQFSRTIADKVVHERVAVLTSDAQADERFAAGASIVALGIRSAMAAPIWRGETVEGLVYVDTPLQTRAFDPLDLSLLAAVGNQIAVAIEQARLQRSVLDEQLVRRRLERYHSPAVVERIRASSRDDAPLAADEHDVTVLFADVVGFTQRCEQLEPRAVAAWLNRYFGEMAEVIFRHEGTLDKFIGDCLMAVFGAPFPAVDHARRAVDAALEMRDVLDRLNRPLDEAERAWVRIGIHSGKVIAGDIGSPSRSDYTVLGATVNLAARLEAEVARPGQIVISDATQRALGPGYATRVVGAHRPRGISRDVPCYEVVGRA